ncbi:unnamed protein product [Owenia fusiformis]|uniref:Uncharacterized protein n=1 Tax=Owenia fusiformis TaxID=6347 RepID=A0A8J1XMA9_OWEFU|nr:unnamed protein product [Owenia fusiformis]
MNKVQLVLCILGVLASVVTAQLGGRNPRFGTCLCVTGSSVNVRDNAGLNSRVIGSINRGQCYKYTGLKLTRDGYSWYTIDYNGRRGWVAGNYLIESAASRCQSGGGRPGCGRVDYRGYRVSDSQVRAKLVQIADLFCNRLWVTSGDRPNGRPGSHHYVGRAADFWIDGQSNNGGAMFDRIRRSGIMNTDYQVIWHGSRTCTGGEHIHIGRYTDGRRTCWVHEGTRPGNRCQYRCM